MSKKLQLTREQLSILLVMKQTDYSVHMPAKSNKYKYTAKNGSITDSFSEIEFDNKTIEQLANMQLIGLTMCGEYRITENGKNVEIQ